VIQPIRDGAGAIAGVFVEGFDVTDQVRAQQAANESERRLSAATAIARLGVFELDIENGVLVMDDRAREIFGFERDEALTIAKLVSRIAPDDAARATSLTAKETRRQIEYRIQLPDGTSRNVATLRDVTRAPDGKAIRMIGVMADATERRRAENHQRLLINELNHRVKNTLATVQSIAAQTLRAAPDTASARASFEARLMALAATHDVLTAESWHGARIADVVSSAMAPFESTRRPQIQRLGPPVWVSAPRALALSMALHELATNAVKYGALSEPGGRVNIRWRRTKASELVLEWVEQGGPPVAPPTRSGFGTRLVQRSLARELGGQVEFHFAPEGVSCEIRFPIAEAPPQATLADLAL
jgi:PAS domain S-box-containing protein